MKKLLCFVFFAFVFIVSSVNVEAITIDYESKCSFECRDAGSSYNYCLSSCAAEKYIEEYQPGCTSDECYKIKYNYYLDYYNKTTSGDFNYSTFDYDSCFNECRNAGSGQGHCKAECSAKEDTRTCILNSYSNLRSESCKNNYETKLNDYKIKYGVTSGSDNKDENQNSDALNKCSNKCSKECENEENPSECHRYCYQNCVNAINNPPKKIQCGDFKIPYLFAKITSTIVTILKIATPIIVILLGSIDFAKGVIAQKEDEIKKGQQIFIRRLILGVLVFLVFAIVQLVIGLVAPNDSNQNIWNCVDCMINGFCN